MIRAIGILGGTFDPVHIGHLVLARDAREQLGLEQVLLVPCAVPPHKARPGLTPAEARLAMLRMAAEGDPAYPVSDIEVRRGGVSYTIDTVSALCREAPGVSIRFLVGIDALPELHLWKDITALLGLCRIIPFRRPGMPPVRESDIRLPAPWPARLAADQMTGHQLDVSSSDIRQRVAAGLSIRHLVPPAVERYILANGLYRR